MGGKILTMIALERTTSLYDKYDHFKEGSIESLHFKVNQI